MINPLNGHAANQLVEKYIGTAYDCVKNVCKNMDFLKELNLKIGQPQGVHPPVWISTDQNIVLTGDQLIRGLKVPNGGRILVKDQTNPKENGIYTYNKFGDWVRASDFNDPDDVLNGQLITSNGGGDPNNVGTYKVFIDTPTLDIGVTEVTFDLAIDRSGYGDPDVTALNLTNGVRNSVGYQTADEIRELPVPTPSNLKVNLIGHGDYVWDASSILSEDGVGGAGGSVIERTGHSGSGRWVYQGKCKYYLSSFITGDIDAHIALHNCIVAAKDGGTVYIDRDITLTNTCAITDKLKGVSIKYCGGMITLGSNVGIQIHNSNSLSDEYISEEVTIDGLRMSQPPTSTVLGQFIKFYKTNKPVVKNCVFENGGNGTIYIGGGCWYGEVRGNKFTGVSSYSTTRAVWITGTDHAD